MQRRWERPHDVDICPQQAASALFGCVESSPRDVGRIIPFAELQCVYYAQTAWATLEDLLREDNPAPGKTTIHDADQRRIWIYGFENWIPPDANAFNRWAMNNVKRDLISGLRLDNSG